jgi:UDP-2-acetamido-3-amino-2,3-dideoxy-glucuronate N-acetyltransferase
MLVSNYVVEPGVILRSGVFVGANSVIRTGCVVGAGSVIGPLTVIEEGVTIGERVRIQAHCYITKGMVIEDDVFIGPCFESSNDRRVLSHGRGVFVLDAPVIRRAARIGAGCLLLPGVDIGENAFVGAASLVTRSVPANEMWYGHPARFQRMVPDEERL